jgi:hypothetical protein
VRSGWSATACGCNFRVRYPEPHCVDSGAPFARMTCMPKSGACWLLSVLYAGVMSKPDATLAEMQAWLIAEHDVRVSAGGAFG